MDLVIEEEVNPGVKFVDTLKSWISEEGWFNCSLQSIDDIALSPHSHFINVFSKLGETLGTVVYTINPNSVYIYVGPFIVRKDMRGKGIGKQIWSRMMHNAAKIDEKYVMLNSAPGEVELYKSWGFPHLSKLLPYFKLGPVDALVKALQQKLAHINTVEYETVEINESNKDRWIPAMINYDTSVAGRDRSEWFSDFVKNSLKCVIHVELGKLKGLAIVAQAMNDQIKIGPLYANNSNIGLNLLNQIVGKLPPFSTVGFTIFPHSPSGKIIKEMLDEDLPGWIKESVHFAELTNNPIADEQNVVDFDKVVIASRHLFAYEC